MKRTLWPKRARIALFCAGTLAFIIAGATFHWKWAGFDKPLYDWMQLLIIPVALTLLAIWFNRFEQKNEQAITSDNQQEVVLQGYFDRMSELLTEKKLRESKLGDEIRNIARMRTFTTLHQLNPRRKEYMVAFLRESGLLTSNAGTNIITFRNADLRKIDFHEMNLHEIDLSGANLRGANLRGADLSGANLSGADLSGADLSGANLSGADLEDANLKNANLRWANLYEANLSNTIFCGADLRGAYLISAELRGANLVGANLKDAILCEAILIKTILMATNLKRADLRGANLKGAIIDTLSLAKAHMEKEQKATLSIREIIHQRHRLPLTHRGLRKLLLPPTLKNKINQL